MSRRKKNKNKYKDFDLFKGTEFEGKVGAEFEKNKNDKYLSLDKVLPFISKHNRNNGNINPNRSKSNNTKSIHLSHKRTNYELILDNEVLYHISASNDWLAFEEVAKFINEQGNLGEYTLMCRKNGQNRVVVVIEGPASGVSDAEVQQSSTSNQ